jgi:hypothetical protein
LPEACIVWLGKYSAACNIGWAIGCRCETLAFSRSHEGNLCCVTNEHKCIYWARLVDIVQGPERSSQAPLAAAWFIAWPPQIFTPMFVCGFAWSHTRHHLDTKH